MSNIIDSLCSVEGRRRGASRRRVADSVDPVRLQGMAADARFDSDDFIRREEPDGLGGMQISWSLNSALAPDLVSEAYFVTDLGNSHREWADPAAGGKPAEWWVYVRLSTGAEWERYIVGTPDVIAGEIGDIVRELAAESVPAAPVKDAVRDEAAGVGFMVVAFHRGVAYFLHVGGNLYNFFTGKGLKTYSRAAAAIKAAKEVSQRNWDAVYVFRILSYDERFSSSDMDKWANSPERVVAVFKDGKEVDSRSVSEAQTVTDAVKIPEVVDGVLTSLREYVSDTDLLEFFTEEMVDTPAFLRVLDSAVRRFAGADAAAIRKPLLSVIADSRARRASGGAARKVSDSVDQRVYDLFDGICREGIDNSQWGLCKDVDVRNYFGVNDDLVLSGQYVYIYCPVGEEFAFIKATPDYVLSSGENEEIRIYAL